MFSLNMRALSLLSDISCVLAVAAHALALAQLAQLRSSLNAATEAHACSALFSACANAQSCMRLHARAAQVYL